MGYDVCQARKPSSRNGLESVENVVLRLEV
jgi:hypothetical protein